jgi:hypothetical protein
MSLPMSLVDWQGLPVIPRDWLRGFVTIYPLAVEWHPTGGPWQIGQKQMWRMETALKKRNEDGSPNS